MTMANMRDPIIVVENVACIYVFDSKVQAERYLEAIDVLNGEYTAYESEGRLLSLEVVEKDRVRIAVADDVPKHEAELMAILQKHLEIVYQHHQASETDYVTGNLASLVAECRKWDLAQ